MIEYLYLVVIALAAARLSVLLVEDTILEPVRNRVWLRFPPKDNPTWGFEYQKLDTDGSYLPEGITRGWSMFGELLSCNRCVSVWTTALCFIAAVATDTLSGHWLELTLKALAVAWLASWGAARI